MSDSPAAPAAPNIPAIRGALVTFCRNLRQIVDSINVADPEDRDMLFNGVFGGWLHEQYEFWGVTRDELEALNVAVDHEELDTFLFEYTGPVANALYGALPARPESPTYEPLYREYVDILDNTCELRLEGLHRCVMENFDRHIAEYREMCDPDRAATTDSLRDVVRSALGLADLLRPWGGTWGALKELRADLKDAGLCE